MLNSNLLEVFVSLQDISDRRRKRASFYDDGRYAWNLRRTPDCLTLADCDGETSQIEHPSHHHAIFVVHGIGEQAWTETAATLHSGFEDALEDIAAWQARNQTELKTQIKGNTCLPPPFILDGFWGDYADLEANFPEDLASFEPREKAFFGAIWKHRATSGLRTLFWFFKQQLRLLEPRTLEGVGLRNWLLYIPLQLVAFTVLIAALIRRPRILKGFLNDVRLYVDPRGVVERAIVQRIDRRVATEFMRMLGLDLDFRPLPASERLQASGSPVQFKRVVWVAHSLGTVISYNVLSALFERAAELEASGDKAQQGGVQRFRSSLVRFITLGSPLDKIAFLFGENALRPWPQADRDKLLGTGDAFQPDAGVARREWWINFYHVMDPVSGPLEDPLIVGNCPPVNRHARTWSLPGIAHVDYWHDRPSLRFILGRTYGREVLQDKPLQAWPPSRLRQIALAAYSVWALLIAVFLWLLGGFGVRLFERALSWFAGAP